MKPNLYREPTCWAAARTHLETPFIGCFFAYLTTEDGREHIGTIIHAGRPCITCLLGTETSTYYPS